MEETKFSDKERDAYEKLMEAGQDMRKLIKSRIALECYCAFECGVKMGWGLQESMKVVYEGIQEFSDATKKAVMAMAKDDKDKETK